METASLPEYIVSWETAEKNALELLLAATKPVLANVGGGIGEAPSRFGAFSFRITAPDPNDYANNAAFWDAHSFPAIASKAEVMGAFKTREEAQRFTMALVFDLPRKVMKAPEGLPDAGFVQQLRINSLGEVRLDAIGDGQTAWTVTHVLDIVFLTGAKASTN